MMVPHASPASCSRQAGPEDKASWLTVGLLAECHGISMDSIFYHIKSLTIWD